MWLCFCSGRPFEDAFENAQRRKVKQMQPMWLCFFLGRRFEDTFENSHWRKVIQMQPLWLCICSSKQFEEPFENAHWRKIIQIQLFWLWACETSSAALKTANYWCNSSFGHCVAFLSFVKTESHFSLPCCFWNYYKKMVHIIRYLWQIFFAPKIYRNLTSYSVNIRQHFL